MPIRVLENAWELQGAADRWRDLWRRAPGADLFTSFEWVDAWWGAFGTPGALSVLCVERAGRFVALLPLMRASPPGAEPGSPSLLTGLASGRRLTSVFNHYSGRSDVLLDPTEPTALEELFGGLLALRDTWEVVELDWYPEDSAAYHFLAGGGVPGLSVYAVRTSESPHLALPQAGFASWYSRRFSSKTRSRDRVSLREAASRPGFKLEVLTGASGGALRGALGAAIELESKGWKGSAGTAMKQDPRASRFVIDAATRLGELGATRVTWLEIEGRPAAFVLGFVSRGSYFYFKTSFDPELEELRPGRMVTNRTIQTAFEEGLSRFDFLGAADDYKLRYTAERRPHATVFLYHDGTRSRLHRTVKRRLIPLAKLVSGRGMLFPVRVDR